MRRQILVGSGVVALWVVLQLVFRDAFIFHDAWKHGFPMFFNVARQTTCWGLPHWVGTVDSGSPLVIQAISIGLTQIIRLPVLYLTGCLRLGLFSALYFYKAQLVISYLAFAGGMFVLGTVLFHTRTAAFYLFVATLYAGMFLDTMHSSQIVSIVFWMPWIVAAGVLFHRETDAKRQAWYLNGLVLFACIGALDQYPHYVLLAVVVGAGLYMVVWPERAGLFRLRGLARLWPALVVLLITASQMAVIKDAIVEYQPSLRESLIVHPRLFGETGFVQPTAVIGSLLPLGFVGVFDQLVVGMMHQLAMHQWLHVLTWPGNIGAAFIFRLDALIFNVGFIPTVLALAFVIQPGKGRVRAWWLGFAGVLLLVSLQQSGIYLLLFRLPFFNVFRIYFLYVAVVVFATLVMSGYGMDAFLVLPREDRYRVFRRSLAVVLWATVLAGGMILWLLSDAPRGVALQAAKYLSMDGALIVVGAVGVRLGSRTKQTRLAGIGLIAVVALSQAAYFGVTESMLGISRDELISRFGLEDEDSRELPADVEKDPNRFRRKECTVFAQCYASLRETVSLRRDLEGTFLRSKKGAIFQNGLKMPVVKALLGLTHPVFWFSEKAAEFGSRRELIEELNTHADGISDYLRQVVHLRQRDLKRLAPEDLVSGGSHELLAMERGQDVIRLRYVSDRPVLLNASITYDPSWIASVRGSRLRIVRGNVDGLAMLLPAGSGWVVLSYRSWTSWLFFVTRYICLLVGAVAAAFVARAALGRGSRLAVSNTSRAES